MKESSKVEIRQLAFATNNKHKLEEVRAMFGKEYTLLSLDDLGFTDEIEETEMSLEGNALLKARAIYERFRTNVFADDTGLEVYALEMRPGVFSARYAGPQKNDSDNISFLLSELNPFNDRRARFRTVFALIIDGSEYLFEGVVEGIILPQTTGTAGFGYDPVFCPEGHNRSFAEMSAEEKNSISHRRRALEAMLTFLKSGGQS